MLTTLLISVAFLVSPSLAGGPAHGEKVPPKVEPTKLDNFTWTDPFSSPKLLQFETACESQRTFTASEYQLHDLVEVEPQGLWPYSSVLRDFFGGRPYPGGWDGWDAHGYERNLIKMEYVDVPVKVREWVEKQESGSGPGKGLFAVYDKPSKGEQAKKTAGMSKVGQERIMIFAPGALYEILPLWVAEGSGCEDTLADLSKYSPQLVEGGVIAWPTDHNSPLLRSMGHRKMKFTIKAQVLSAEAKVSVDKEGDDAARTDSKDEL